MVAEGGKGFAGSVFVDANKFDRHTNTSIYEREYGLGKVEEC
jgi:hypothetical protein